MSEIEPDSDGQEQENAEDSAPFEADPVARAERAFHLAEEAAVGGSEEETPGEPAVDLQVELEGARQEAAENYDKYLRAVAELENFKKRTLKERSELIRYAGENLARDLLDVADDLDRASGHEAGTGEEPLLQGVKLIAERFKTVLERHFVSAEDALGKPFDPSKEEALTTVQTDDVPPGTVIEQLRKAYFFKDKLLRSAQVVVSVEKTPQESESED